MTSQDTLSPPTANHTDALSPSVPHGCIELRSKERDYLPWNNSANLVSHQAALYAIQVRCNVLHVLFLIGGPANVINMAVFFRLGLRDRVNLLLFSLSLADELYLITSVLYFSEEFYAQFFGTFTRNGGDFRAWLTNNFVFGFFGCIFVSFLLSALIACDRCYCVLRPLQYQTALRTRTLAGIIVAVYGVVLALFCFVGVKYYISCAYDPDTGLVSQVFVHREFYRNHRDVIDYMDSIIFGAGFPTLMMVVVTMATGVTIWKLGQLAAWRAQSSSAAMSARKVALTKMLAAASVLLVLCASLGCAFRLAGLFLPEMSSGRRHQNFYLLCITITQMFFYVNCSYNFVIYYLMSSRFRETFWALLGRKGGLKKSKE